jgi:hypothetical protein
MLTPELVAEIIALAALVVPVTQAVKKWFKLEGNNALIVSAAAAVIFALWKTLSLPPYDWGRFVILVVGVFLQANGIYHFGAYAVGKMTARKA